jgi:hypothetical protein
MPLQILLWTSLLLTWGWLPAVMTVALTFAAAIGARCHVCGHVAWRTERGTSTFNRICARCGADLMKKGSTDDPTWRRRE